MQKLLMQSMFAPQVL